MTRAIVATLVIIAGLLGAAPPASAQGVVWVRTFERIGPNACLERVAEWSDGTYTAAVVNCAGQDVGAGDLTYLGYFEAIGPDGCREGVSYWSNGEFTWVPLECPPGVVYVKPDWDRREPWNHQDPFGRVRPPARVQPATGV